MRNIKLLISYDGTAYHGFQIQKNAVTIQEMLETALRSLTGEETAVTGCSRTDAGVHAVNYVCNFRSNTGIPCDKLPYALNTRLPEDISCMAAEEADEDFHARFSAKSKIYVYKIYNAPLRNALRYKYSWHYPYKIDVNLMKQACGYLLGEHDFTAFMASGGQQKTTVKTIYSLEVSDSGHDIEIKIHANSYLYNMVRIIAGTLVYIGNGKIEPNELEDIIKSGDRTRAGITAPPQGLFLYKGCY